MSSNYEIPSQNDEIVSKNDESLSRNVKLRRQKYEILRQSLVLAEMGFHIFSQCWITFRKAKQKSVQNNGHFFHSKCGIISPFKCCESFFSTEHFTEVRVLPLAMKITLN